MMCLILAQLAAPLFGGEAAAGTAIWPKAAAHAGMDPD